MNTTFSKIPWDTVQSTYRQEITLENGKWYPGYSKRIGKEEVKDKTVLLQNMVLRMFHVGYLDESNHSRDNAESIAYYWKSDKKQYVHAFTLYQDCYEWNPDHFRDYLDSFLKELYRLKGIGKNPYEILYVTKRSKKDDPLSLSTKRFYDKENLKNYCTRLIKKDIRSQGEVKNFFIKYAEQFLDGFNPRDEEFFNNINFG